MRNNALTNLLVGVAALCVILTAGAAFLYVRSVRNLNRLQFQSAVINRNRALANSLANDTLEYSKRNPAIDPILQSVGLKPKPGAAASQSVPKP
jgi:hypothetical protein